MTLNEYQEIAAKTASYPGQGKNYIYPTLGLAAEAGEVANKIKKVERDANGIIDAERLRDIVLELGDVLWYAAQLATELGVPLDDVAQANVDKLRSRRERGALHGSGDTR